MKLVTFIKLNWADSPFHVYFMVTKTGRDNGTKFLQVCAGLYLWKYRLMFDLPIWNYKPKKG